MILIFILCAILCVINIYRRLNCAIKSKITKFNIFSFLVFSSVLLFLNYRYSKGFYENLFPIAMICLSFFTSIISSGISKRGFIQPWNLYARLHTWDKIERIVYELKEESIMLTFETKFTQYRQEFERKDLDKIKEFLYRNAKKKIKEIRKN